jgi:outer membrane protein assembly factor BamB
MGTAALDLSGKVLWRQTGVKYPPLHGNGGSPVLAGDTLVFSCDGIKDPFVIALDAKNGQVRWKTPRNTPAKSQFSFSTPLEIEIDGKPQIVSPGSGFVAAYDPADGREIWKVRYGEGYSLVPRPVFAHGLLFVSTGFDQANLLAIKPSGAQGDVTESNVLWSYRKGVPTTPSPLVLGNEIYFVSDGGIATCLDAQSGKVHWSERLEGGFSASPVSAEGRVYFQNETGTGFVVKAGPVFQLLSRNSLGERTLASYAVIDNGLFIRSESHLWRIGQDRKR